MGSKPRMKPERLAEKLLQIRNSLGLSQTEMLKRLRFEESITYHRVSEWESGKREPPLNVLLAYARSVCISTDMLIDDELILPKNLPNKPKTMNIRHRTTS